MCTTHFCNNIHHVYSYSKYRKAILHKSLWETKQQTNKPGSKQDGQTLAKDG